MLPKSTVTMDDHGYKPPMPRPMLPVNATILDWHSPTALPIMSSNITDDYNHITSEIV
ncbi:hypothetical protein AX17_005580, partial [Amanita inopinata Kibby_2008]